MTKKTKLAKHEHFFAQFLTTERADGSYASYIFCQICGAIRILTIREEPFGFEQPFLGVV